MASIETNGTTSPRGMSLHVGVNHVDTTHYGPITVLKGCINDALAMTELASNQNFEVLATLVEEQATRDAVKAKIAHAAENLQPGDIFFYTYSGHGSNLRDMNEDEKGTAEEAKFDETWCLYDGMLIDDEAGELWAKFKPGVRVLVLLDCCHSGTAIKAGVPTLPRMPKEGTWRNRQLDKAEAAHIYARNKAFYDAIIKTDTAGDGVEPACAVRLIAGCEDDEFSFDGDDNGLFTKTLLRIWDAGNYAGDYTSFHQEIRDVVNMVASQTPKLHFRGTDIAGFIQQKPFTI